MKNINAIIVDDEKLSRDYLKNLLTDYSFINIIEECKNGLEGLNAILTHQPDIVFLDIQMPDLDGFEVIQEVKAQQQMPVFIFITAHDQYALKAFDANAIDYLMKPFDKNRFKVSIDKAVDMILKSKQIEINASVEMLLKMHTESKRAYATTNFLKRLLIKSNKKLLLVDTNDIYWLEASKDYIKVHLKDKYYLLNDSLNNLEEKLDPDLFFRIHRSNIVNINFISELKPHFNGEYILIMKNGQEVKLSRSYKDRFKSFLDNYI